MDKSITDPEVEAAFNAFSPAVKKKLMRLRRLIFEVAHITEGVGEIEETLKWGQPSYLNKKPRIGSTIRLGREKKTDGDYAMYFKCQTTLVPTFRELYKNKFRFEGNRAILFNLDDKIPLAELSRCIEMALTYHLNKKKKQMKMT
jgi:hypothetical protein